MNLFDRLMSTVYCGRFRSMAESPPTLGGLARAWLVSCRESRRLVLVIVAIALLLDNMLLTTVGQLSALQCLPEYTQT